MKFLKMASLLILAGLILVSCANMKFVSTPTAQAQPTLNRQLHEPDEFKTNNNPPVNFYVKHNKWESPFNPHEIIQYWVKIAAQPANKDILVAILGNPKIDWEFLKNKNVDPMKVGIPKGEIASAVVFIFVQTPQRTIELFSYGYLDDLGVQNMYVLNLKTMTYERKEVPKQQKSCLEDHIKAAFVNDPADS
jgi:hypothetical protein